MKAAEPLTDDEKAQFAKMCLALTALFNFVGFDKHSRFGALLLLWMGEWELMEHMQLGDNSESECIDYTTLRDETLAHARLRLAMVSQDNERAQHAKDN